MNNYIVTNFGFVKCVTFNKETFTHTVEYTDKLRCAQAYTSKSARGVMEKHDLIGFIYNPYAQEAVRDMYEVKKKSRYGFMDEEEKAEMIDEWQVVKAFMVNETDANFLQSRKLAGRDLLTLEQAQAKAIELNTAMLVELDKKLKKQLAEAIGGELTEKI